MLWLMSRLFWEEETGTHWDALPGGVAWRGPQLMGHLEGAIVLVEYRSYQIGKSCQPEEDVGRMERKSVLAPSSPVLWPPRGTCEILDYLSPAGAGLQPREWPPRSQ